MKLEKEDLSFITPHLIQAQEITYSNGGKAIVCKKAVNGAKCPIKIRSRCPPINYNEPMTKEALKRILNRYFVKLFELDLIDQNCRFVSFTISKEKYNFYSKISERFKYFIGEVRAVVKNHYLGTIRVIELQANGNFHIHCILVFDSDCVDLSDKTLQKIWGWGSVEDKEIYDRFGLIDYLTNIKHNLENGNSERFTRYPKGARVIYISPNLPKAESKNISLSPAEISQLQEATEFEEHTKIHQYYDPMTKKVRTCIDKKILIQKNKKNKNKNEKIKDKKEEKQK